MIDIYNIKENDKIKCVSDYENSWGGCDPIQGNLEVGKIYTVIKVEVHSWHTRIWVKEVPNKYFNSVHFESVGEEGEVSRDEYEKLMKRRNELKDELNAVEGKLEYLEEKNSLHG